MKKRIVKKKAKRAEMLQAGESEPSAQAGGPAQVKRQKKKKKRCVVKEDSQLETGGDESETVTRKKAGTKKGTKKKGVKRKRDEGGAARKEEQTSADGTDTGRRPARKRAAGAAGATSSIWLPEACSDHLGSLCALHRLAPAAEADPALELRRLKAVKTLRHKLRMLCTRNNGRIPLLAFERWHARALLQERKQNQVPSELVPLVPDLEGWVDEGLIRDLKRVHMDATAGQVVAEGIAKVASTAARGLTPTPAAERAAVQAEDKGRQLDLSVGEQKPYLSINQTHYDKLWQLRAHHNQGDEEDEQVFNDRVFCVLATLEALQGAGYQAALPPSAFSVLRRRLGVCLECFASPLNCTLPNFCSLTPHVDAAFGSRGSFFDLRATKGSFEMNPPFVPELMSAAVRHAEILLEDSKGPMSFAIFVPAWQQVACWDQLKRSTWRRGDVEVVTANEHVFSDGNQHKATDQFRPSSFDTAVAFLQNEAGAQRWQVCPELIAELREAVAARGERVVPTLKEWEHRGQWKGGKKMQPLGRARGGGRGDAGGRGRAGGRRGPAGPEGWGRGRGGGRGRGRGGRGYPQE